MKDWLTMVNVALDSSSKGGGHFRIKVRGLKEEVGYVLQSSENDFMYDVVDADVKIEIEGKVPFPPASHRLSTDGFLRSIPVIDFAWNLVVACKHLGSTNPSTERVAITSTDYLLKFERENESVKALILKRGSDDEVLGGTSLTLAELQLECVSIGQLGLAAIFRDNPSLRGNSHLKRFAFEVELLNRQITGRPRVEPTSHDA